MKYTKLGTTGLEVSRICLGAMSYGDPNRGDHIWTLPLDDARPLIRAALDAGVNFFDTANGYSAGSSEEILGQVLRESASRDEVVIATKVHNRMRPGPNGAGLSRKAILAEIDNSLRRLGVDHVDLYQIHRWDPSTPIEETLEALNDVVRAGKARYVGASSMQAWQFCKALYTSRAHGWARFVSMQDLYNLLSRDEEREMFPLCADQGIGVIPWSPLARGRLTRPWGETTLRTENDRLGKRLYPEVDRRIVDRVGEIATRRGLTRAQVALAWVLSNPVVTSPIIGATKPEHLADAVAAVDVELTADDLRVLRADCTGGPATCEKV
ncbi:MAG TPA: aldo/keto reductase [Pseudonocardiaceae bacterium]|jgi:aryl-alcohol dehydrogenase (NADP+)|nr:aldo/keto reductase [Pseudonocardiaceae bacterium]